MRRAALAALTLAAAAGIHTGTAMGARAQSAGPAESVGAEGLRRPEPGTSAARRAAAEPVPQFTATLSQSFTADSNYNLDVDSPGETYYADTLLELGFLRESENQSFELGINTGLRALWEAGEDFDFTLASPTGGNLAYVVEGPQTAFNAELRYRQRRTDFTLDPNDFVTDEGSLPDNLDRLSRDTQELRYDANVAFTYGTEAPSTYDFRFTGSAIDYSDNSDSLVPRQTALVEGGWTLRLTPVLSSIVGLSYYYYTADNTAETRIRVGEIDAGVVYQPNENVRFRGGIGYADRTREQTVAGERETLDANSGATLRGDVAITQERFRLNGDGRLTTAAPQTRFSFDLRGSYALARGALTGRAFNRYTTQGDGESEVRVTGVSVGLIHNVNAVSRLGFDVALAKETSLDEVDDTSDDTTNTSATLTYSHDITRVVAAEVGYGFRQEQEDGTADSHRVFFSIARSFSAL